MKNRYQYYYGLAGTNIPEVTPVSRPVHRGGAENLTSMKNRHLLAQRAIGRMVQGFRTNQRGLIEIEYLPTYAPELNPVQCVCGERKQRELPNVCPNGSRQLSVRAHRTLRKMLCRSCLITTCWKLASLVE